MSAIINVGVFEITDDCDPDLLLAGITADEGEHYRRLTRRPQRARQYLASRWLLRAHLAHETGLRPTDIAVRYPADGPPVTANLPYRLSLSHSANLCLCASTTTAARIGCDVEWQRPRPNLRAIARHYFHAQESAHLNNANDIRACADFYRLWTLKEATQKALGHGLAGGLRIPAFALAPNLHCLEAPAGRHWAFTSTRLARAGGEYAFALAVADCQAVSRTGVRTPPRIIVNAYAPTRHGPAATNCAAPWCTAFAPDERGCGGSRPG